MGSEGGRQRRLGGYLAEGLTITFGILAALFVDAAWDFRGDRAAEADYLRGLDAEFREARQEIRSDQDRREEMLAAASRVLEARRTGEPMEFAELRSALVDILDYRYYTPNHPILDEVLATGGLEVIRSDELRRALRRYGQERDRLKVVEDRDLSFLFDELSIFLARHVSLDFLAPEFSGPVPPAEQARVLRLLQMDEFGSLVYLRWNYLDTSRRFASGVIRNIEGVLGALEG